VCCLSEVSCSNLVSASGPAKTTFVVIWHVNKTAAAQRRRKQISWLLPRSCLEYDLLPDAGIVAHQTWYQRIVLVDVPCDCGYTLHCVIFLKLDPEVMKLGKSRSWPWLSKSCETNTMKQGVLLFFAGRHMY